MFSLTRKSKKKTRNFSEPLEKLNGKHVVFGKLIEGEEVLKAIEKVGEKNEKPKKPIKSNVLRMIIFIELFGYFFPYLMYLSVDDCGQL